MNPYMTKPKTSNEVEIPENILRELLTASELRMLKNRWHILNLLDSGMSIRAVAEEAGVGTDTVVRVSRMRSKTLKDAMSGKKATTKTPYVFGNSED